MGKIKEKIKARKIEKRREELKNMTERERVEERREEVLAKGRKFKYPLQYAKHRVVLLTTIISVIAVLAIGGFGWAALYKFQSTDDILYRITRVLPVSVAKFGGEKVLYSDYLLIYRSTITPVEKQGQMSEIDDVETMRLHYKRQALDAAEEYAYAMKLARENDITVSGEEIDAEIKKQRQAGGTERSEESFTKILSDNFGLSMNEYRRMVEMALYKAKVQEKVDITASNVTKDVSERIKAGKGIKEIADSLQGKTKYEETGGLVDRMNIDGGRAATAMSLEPGQTSEATLSSSGDGYYFVKLIQKNETSVNYISIEIPFTEFDKLVSKVRESKNYKEMIDIPQDKQITEEQPKTEK